MIREIETERLRLRPMVPSDADNLFIMDSDPLVQAYIGDPVTDAQCQAYIVNVTQQYKENGMGRMIVELKNTSEFLGWAGLKVEHDVNGHLSFHDLGYRLLPRNWGKGYATEAGRALLDYGFNELCLPKVCAYAEVEAKSSLRVLEKLGFQIIETFQGERCEEFWLEIQKPAMT